MVVTQHSGDGKANQYFLRGFNLDHGTDFAFSVDGVPVNLPSHAHGQGYADLNFLIPELVDAIEFKKGPFYPEVGDFSGAGAANIRLVTRLPEGIANLQLGQFGYARALLAESPSLGPGNLLYALEYSHYDGPWDLPENSNRYNGLLRYHWDRGRDGYTLTGSFYLGAVLARHRSSRPAGDRPGSHLAHGRDRSDRRRQHGARAALVRLDEARRRRHDRALAVRVLLPAQPLVGLRLRARRSGQPRSDRAGRPPLHDGR